MALCLVVHGAGIYPKPLNLEPNTLKGLAFFLGSLRMPSPFVSTVFQYHGYRNRSFLVLQPCLF